MPKKVLHVITNFSALGGAEMMLQKLILAQPEYDHYIISLISLSDIYEESLKVAKYSQALNWKIFNTAKIILNLKEKIEEIQPDIIQSWMYHANFMVSIANSLSKEQCPTYWGVHHSLNSITEESLSTKIAIYLNKLLSNKVSGIIYCAQSSLEQHKNFGFKNNNQVFIPNGVDLSKFRYVNRNFKLPVRIGFVGRFHKAKGISCLFDVMSKFNKNSDIIFKVVGQGLSIDNNKILELYENKKIGKNVQLLGPIREMEKFYHDIDILLMTSITEGFPNVLIEAMATGAVCISTDVGDARYIINSDENITSIMNISEMELAINNYIKNDAVLKAKFSEGAYNRVKENFSVGYVANEYKKTWGE